MIYFISSGCPGLIDAIPLAIHDEDKNIEDVKKVDQVSDDCLDAWRYACKSMLTGAAKPQAVVINERLAAVTNMHDKSMMHRFLQKRLQSGNRAVRLRR